jgi:hypothetical protein
LWPGVHPCPPFLARRWPMERHANTLASCPMIASARSSAQPAQSAFAPGAMLPRKTNFKPGVSGHRPAAWSASIAIQFTRTGARLYTSHLMGGCAVRFVRRGINSSRHGKPIQPSSFRPRSTSQLDYDGFREISHVDHISDLRWVPAYCALAYVFPPTLKLVKGVVFPYLARRSSR